MRILKSIFFHLSFGYILLYHNFVNISTVSLVRICLQTRNDARAELRAEMHLQNFEKLQSRKLLVKYSACAECEIIHFVNCEISPFGRCEMKFARIRVSEYFTFAEQIFHSEAISLARRANFVEKSSFFRTSYFLAGMARFELTNAGVKVPCLTAWRHPNVIHKQYCTTKPFVCQALFCRRGKFSLCGR